MEQTLLMQKQLKEIYIKQNERSLNNCYLNFFVEYIFNNSTSTC